MNLEIKILILLFYTLLLLFLFFFSQFNLENSKKLPRVLEIKISSSFKICPKMIQAIFWIFRIKISNHKSMINLRIKLLLIHLNRSIKSLSNSNQDMLKYCLNLLLKYLCDEDTCSEYLYKFKFYLKIL